MQKKNGMEERAQFRNKWKNPFCVNCSWNNPAIWILWAICSWNTHAACILWAVLFISLIYSWIARNTGWDVGDLLVVKMSTFPMWVTGFQSCLHHQFQCPADMDLGQMMAQGLGPCHPHKRPELHFGLRTLIWPTLAFAGRWGMNQGMERSPGIVMWHMAFVIAILTAKGPSQPHALGFNYEIVCISILCMKFMLFNVCVVLLCKNYAKINKSIHLPMNVWIVSNLGRL